jgi:hypothetical protein
MKICAGVSGVTASCSIVPRSRSRAIDVAMTITVRSWRISPITPGMTKFWLLSSGLKRISLSSSIGDTCSRPCSTLSARPSRRRRSAARNAFCCTVAAPSSRRTDGAVNVSDASTTVGRGDVGLRRVLDDLRLERDRGLHRLDVLLADPPAVEVDDARLDARHARAADRVAEDHRQNGRHEDEKGEGAAVAHQVQELLQREVVDVAHQRPPVLPGGTTSPRV